MIGWIKVHRQFNEWGWRKKANYVSVFMDILLGANHADGEYRGVKIPRGSMTTSIDAISKRTGVTYKSVRTILKNLERSNEVAIKTTPHYTMITVIKWDDYQSTGEVTGKQRANDGQTMGKQRATNKNVIIKKGKKEKNLSPSDVIALLNEITGRTYKATGGNAKHAQARINEDYTIEEFRSVFVRQHKAWGSNPEMSKYLRPETILGQKFDGYLQDAKSADKPIVDPLDEFLVPFYENMKEGVQ